MLLVGLFLVAASPVSNSLFVMFTSEPYRRWYYMLVFLLVLATIKVLGFYDKEVYRYIFREIDLLSLIGSLVGLVVGIPLHQFIIRTVEMDQMMFIRSIAPRSFVFSVALTMLFNFAVCLLMRRHVRQISMVESMKAPE